MGRGGGGGGGGHGGSHGGGGGSHGVGGGSHSIGGGSHSGGGGSHGSGGGSHGIGGGSHGCGGGSHGSGGGSHGSGGGSHSGGGGSRGSGGSHAQGGGSRAGGSHANGGASRSSGGSSHARSDSANGRTAHHAQSHTPTRATFSNHVQGGNTNQPTRQQSRQQSTLFGKSSPTAQNEASFSFGRSRSHSSDSHASKGRDETSRSRSVKRSNYVSPTTNFNDALSKSQPRNTVSQPVSIIKCCPPSSNHSGSSGLLSSRSSAPLSSSRSRSASTNSSQFNSSSRGTDVSSRSMLSKSQKSASRRSARSQRSGRSQRSQRSKKITRQERSNSTSRHIVQTDNLSRLDKAHSKEMKSKDQNRQSNKQFPSGHVVIYTDGSATKNCSGLGIYMGPKHPLNRSESINTAPHNSNRAEILAATRALSNLNGWKGYRNEPVILRTDSLMIVRAMGGSKDLTKISLGKELSELRRTAEQLRGGVCFEHVPAHSDHIGNLAADSLARQATAGVDQSRSESRSRSRASSRARSHSDDQNYDRRSWADVKEGGME